METPLYAAILEFFVRNPGYKISPDEFVGLVNMLSKDALKEVDKKS